MLQAAGQKFCTNCSILQHFIFIASLIRQECLPIYTAKWATILRVVKFLGTTNYKEDIRPYNMTLHDLEAGIKGQI